MTESPDKRTEDQSAPAKPPSGSLGREAFVVAFPFARALPIPPSDEAFGRDWLAAKATIHDPKASAKHCRVMRRGGVFIEDLGSHNGTWVDGVRIPTGERIALDEGSVVRIGRTLLVYRHHLIGPDEPSPPIGSLVAPYGLRSIQKALDGVLVRRPMNVLIEGETGTGKELLAAEVARRLGRGQRYDRINVTAVPKEVFEGTLFGHVPGAYTGARVGGSPGVLLTCQGGALCLDEIGELPLDLQPKLLRLLENREMWRVGAQRSERVDILIIGSTNRSLDDMVGEGRFRRDLLARLRQYELHLPPLRARREDIFAIAQAWSTSKGQPFDLAEVEVEAVERILLDDWESNVRELYAVLDRVAVEDGPGVLHEWAIESALGAAPMSRGPVTRERAEAAVERNHGNQSAAARELGINRPRLLRILGKRK